MIAIALVGGLARGLFSRLTLLCVGGLPGIVGRFQRSHPATFALLCGVTLAGIGQLTGGRTYGTGYVEARMILEHNTPLPWIYAPARAAATLVSCLSGIPAGLLAASLSVGAGLGQVFADLFGESSLAYPAVLRMSGYLAGVTQAPLTTFCDCHGDDRRSPDRSAPDADRHDRDRHVETRFACAISHPRRSLFCSFVNERARSEERCLPPRSCDGGGSLGRSRSG